MYESFVLNTNINTVLLITFLDTQKIPLCAAGTVRIVLDIDMNTKQADFSFSAERCPAVPYRVKRVIR